MIICCTFCSVCFFWVVQGCALNDDTWHWSRERCGAEIREGGGSAPVWYEVMMQLEHKKGLQRCSFEM